MSIKSGFDALELPMTRPEIDICIRPCYLGRLSDLCEVDCLLEQFSSLLVSMIRRE